MSSPRLWPASFYPSWNASHDGSHPLPDTSVIPARFQQWVFVFFMTLLMGLVLSLIFELQGSGYRIENALGFLSGWLRRFLGTYVIVLPVVLVINPVAGRLSRLVIAEPPHGGDGAENG